MQGTSGDCERVHRALKRIAKARGSLDLQEAEALREAERLAVWRQYGYASLVQYMEMELGYSPRAALERIRVAKVIKELPVIAAKLDQGEIPFSAAREITRVATPETEGDWVAACADRNSRQVEALVAEHHRGDRPTDPPDPTLRRKVLRFEVKLENYALWRQIQQLLAKEAGEHRLDDDALIAAIGHRILDGGAAEHPRPRHQVAVTVCTECKRGWQDGAGVTVEMSPAAVERAECDAVTIGSVDAKTPEPTTQTIPEPVRRLVLARDHHRCRVPWCSSSHNVDLHHLRHRRDGGTHIPDNLLTLCESHHIAHHEGLLDITGTATNPTFTRCWWKVKTHVGFASTARDQGQGQGSGFFQTLRNSNGAVGGVGGAQRRPSA